MPVADTELEIILLVVAAALPLNREDERIVDDLVSKRVAKLNSRRLFQREVSKY